MKIASISFALAALLAAGCASTPQTLPGAAPGNPDQMAVISVALDEVKIVEVDGRPLPASASSEFYLAPGAHRFAVEWHPCPGGLCTSSGVYAERPRTACFSTQAGGRYRVSARNPGPDWEPRVTEKLGAGEARTIESRCS